jgi:hypothetical protein
MKVDITRPGYRCERCGHEWIARARRHPRICPHCKRPLAGTTAPPPGPSEQRIDHEFWNPVDFDTIAARQGGPKVFDLSTWKRPSFLPDDFDVEEFLAPIHEERRRSRGG